MYFYMEEYEEKNMLPVTHHLQKYTADPIHKMYPV